MDYSKYIDYSSLSCYMDCPRKFLFKYLLHLNSSKANINLVFGSAWHYGMEIAYKALQADPTLLPTDLTSLAIKAFNLYWSIEGEPHFPDPDLIFPKSPARAADLYHKYFKEYKFIDQDQGKTVLGVESPFEIALGNGLPSYIGRIDLIFKLANESLEIVDHKTSKAIYPITYPSQIVSFQTDGYLTAGHMFYDSIPRMTYNIALLQKSKVQILRNTVMKNKAALEHFLHNLKQYISQIILNLEKFHIELKTLKDKKDLLTSFPRCPGNACTTFMRACTYLDICQVRNNPLLWKDNAPQGFVVKEWDPIKHEEETKALLAEAC